MSEPSKAPVASGSGLPRSPHPNLPSIAPTLAPQPPVLPGDFGGYPVASTSSALPQGEALDSDGKPKARRAFKGAEPAEAARRTRSTG